MRVDRLMLCTRAELVSSQGQRCREESSGRKGLLGSEDFLCMGAFLHRG